MASIDDPEQVGPDDFHHKRFVGVEWYPFGEAGISINCLKEGRQLFHQWTLHPLKAELGHFLGAAHRRLKVTELIDDSETELSTIEQILNIDRLPVNDPDLERTEDESAELTSEQTTGASHSSEILAHQL